MIRGAQERKQGLARGRQGQRSFTHDAGDVATTTASISNVR